MVRPGPLLGGGPAHGQPVPVQLAAFRPAHTGVPGSQRRDGAGEHIYADLESQGAAPQTRGAVCEPGGCPGKGRAGGKGGLT